MKLSPIRQAIAEQAAIRRPALAGEPYSPTPGQSFDVGPLVDDANIEDAGGYPDATALITDDPARPEATGPRRTRPLRRLVTQRYTFALASDGPAVLVTPSGIDGEDVLSVTLVASVNNRLRYGMTDNGAASGAYLPNAMPLVIECGPVWLWPVSGATDTTVDVCVVYETPAPSAKPTPCGCK